MRWSILFFSSPRQYAAARAHQLERRDPLGGGQVRAAAQVAPGDLAVAVEVVVDGQLAGADLDVRALGRGLGVAGALEPDQLELVRLVLELVERVGVGGHPRGRTAGPP